MASIKTDSVRIRRELAADHGAQSLTFTFSADAERAMVAAAAEARPFLRFDVRDGMCIVRPTKRTVLSQPAAVVDARRRDGRAGINADLPLHQQAYIAGYNFPLAPGKYALVLGKYHWFSFIPADAPEAAGLPTVTVSAR